MHIIGPSSAKQGDRITITAGGLPSAAEQVKFNASGNTGFDIVSVSGGSASFSIALDFSGTTTIEVTAQDKFGATLESGSHSISVQDTGFNTGRAPPRPGQRRFGMGGSLSGIYEAIVGTMTDVYAQAGSETEQVQFSASNADMGWMTPQPISPGGSTSASVRLTSEGSATIYAKFFDKAGNALGEASHVIRVLADAVKQSPAPTNSPRLGMGGSLSGITEAIVGMMADIQATGYGETEQVEFSASNADMGWLMPQTISPGGSTSASVRLTTEGTATIFATFKDKLGNVLGNASHAIRVIADTSKRPAATGPRVGMGGSLSGITEAIVGAMADIQATGYGETTQVEFSASNAEMGWMMPVQISPGGSTSASVKLTAEGVATVFATFKDSLGTILGQAQHSIRVTSDPARKPGPTDMASLMNARAAEIMKRMGNKS